jgi:hypothetical protein
MPKTPGKAGGSDPTISVGNPTLKTQGKQDRFLIAFADVGVITKACKAAGTTTGTVDKWKKQDILFLERYNEAQRIHNDKLEGMLFDLIGEMHKNLDYKANPTLLIFALNGAMPTKYKGVAQSTNDARDIITEWRKARREEISKPGEKEQVEPDLLKSAVEQASEILESKRGSLNDTDGK